MPRLAPQALHLPGLRVTADPQHASLRDARVGLPESHSGLRRRADKRPDRTVVQPCVGRVADLLLLDGRVDVHALKIGFPDQLSLETCAYALGEHLLRALPAYTPAPACHARGVERELMLEVGPAREVLSVRVFEPSGQHLLVAHIRHMLEVMHPDHHAHGD